MFHSTTFQVKFTYANLGCKPQTLQEKITDLAALKPNLFWVYG